MSLLIDLMHNILPDFIGTFAPEEHILLRGSTCAGGRTASNAVHF